MSVPTKCDQCGAKGTFAIQTPCVLGCGGLMYYDHAPSPAPAGLREAVQKIAARFKDERHATHAETEYWLNQYRLAVQELAALASATGAPIHPNTESVK